MDTRTGQVFEATTDEIGTVRGALSPDDPMRFQSLPHKALPECRTCKGRGVIRSWGTEHRYGACPSCYPDHETKAVSFAKRLQHMGRKGKA